MHTDQTNIDPIPQYRNALNDGLQVQGAISFPKKINLETIQPVVVINSFAVHRDTIGGLQADMAGIATAFINIINPAALNIKTAILKILRLTFETNAAGRAGMVAAARFPYVAIEYSDQIGTFFPLIIMRWNFGARAAPLFMEYNNFMFLNGPYDGTDAIVVPFTSATFNELVVNSPMTIRVRCYSNDAVNFPAATLFNAYWRYEY